MRKWPTVKLDDVCRKITDGSHFSPKSGFGDYPYVTVRDITDGVIDLVNCSKIERPDFESLERSGCRPLKGDVLFSKDGTVGKVALVDSNESFVVLSSLAILRPDPTVIYPTFLKYVMLSPEVLKQSLGMKTGVAIRRIILRNLKSVTFTLPPLSEQHRIVGILDQAFEGIAKAKANAEQTQKNGRELIAEIRNSYFLGFASSFPSVQLSEVCEFENGDRGSNYPGKQHRTTSGIPFINAGHLENGEINFSEMDYISEDRFNLLRNGKIRPDDVLFCLRGSLGKFASVGNLTNGAIASSLVIIRTHPSISRDYLLEYLASSLCAESIEKLRGGTAQPNLGAKDLKRFFLPLPPLAEQSTAAKSIKRSTETATALVVNSTTKLKALHDLKQSLLHQAFTGNL